MRKILSLFCLALLFPLVSCNDYTIPEDAYYPLKIGVLVLNDTAADANDVRLKDIDDIGDTDGERVDIILDHEPCGEIVLSRGFKRRLAAYAVEGASRLLPHQAVGV